MILFHVKKKFKGEGAKLEIEVGAEMEIGQTLAIYGDSGVGKTSVLRMIAGLLKPDSGSVVVQGQEWYDSRKGTDLKTSNRSIGYTFQEYALFPHMTVRQNLRYALPRGQDQGIIDELLEITDLKSLSDRKPGSLSGGQQQRTALARSLVRKPQLVLLDEPLSALDHKIRRILQDYLVAARQQYGFSLIVVTHDLSEIFRIADQVLVLENGHVTRRGTPQEVFSVGSPAGKFRFTGEVVEIRKEDVIYVLSVLIGNTVTKVVADPTEVEELRVGDRVLVASKAFNPIIKKIS